MKGKAVIAVTGSNEWVGFSYIETWANGEFVSNSGLTVSPAYRKLGVARMIKEKIFDLSRRRYPDAKIFSITTGLYDILQNKKYKNCLCTAMLFDKENLIHGDAETV